MECIKKTFDRKEKSITILIVSDLHIGSKKCDKKAVNKLIERIKNEPKTYCIVRK